MSIDPQIISQLKLPQQPTPFEQLGQLQTLEGQDISIKEHKAELAKQQKAQQDADQIGAAYKAAQTVAPDGTVTFNQDILLKNVPAEHLPAMQKEISAAQAAKLVRDEKVAAIRKSGLEADKMQAEIDAANVELSGSMAAQVRAAGDDPHILGFSAAIADGGTPEASFYNHIQQGIKSGLTVTQIVDAALHASKTQSARLTAEAAQAATAANLKDDNTRADATLAETVRHNKADEAKAAQGGVLTGNAAAERGDATEIVKGLKDGTTSPNVLESARTTALGAAIQAEAHRQGVDTAKMTRNWIATKKAIQSLNSTQQIRLTEAIDKASASLDKVDELNAEWSKNATRWGWKELNSASLALAKNGQYGKEAASVAQRLEGQIADVTAEIGTVIMGGGSPTDHGLELAGKNLGSNWDEGVLRDSVKQVRYNLNLAGNARNDLLRDAGVDVKDKTPAAHATGPKPPTDKTMIWDSPTGPVKWNGKTWEPFGG